MGQHYQPYRNKRDYEKTMDNYMPKIRYLSCNRQILQRHKLQKLAQEEIKSLNRSVTIISISDF